MIDLALVTCKALPEWEIDDRFLHGALRDAGLTFHQPVWCDPDVRWEDFRLVLLRTPWDYHLRLSAFLRWAQRVSEIRPLLNPLAIIEWNAHKRYLHDLLQRGIPIVPTSYLDRGSVPDLPALCAVFRAEFGVDRCVLKPAISATAHETLPFGLDESGLAAGGAHLRRLLPEHDLLLQPWCEAVRSEGEYSLITIEGQLAHAVRKVPKPGDYRVQDDYGARDEPWTPTDDALHIMARVLRTLPPHVLYARIDLLRAPNGQLSLSELELIEPSLFFRHAPKTAELLAERLTARLASR